MEDIFRDERFFSNGPVVKLGPYAKASPAPAETKSDGVKLAGWLDHNKKMSEAKKNRATLTEHKERNGDGRRVG